MVAITVILAAVIGTFVLGLGDEMQTTAPNAQFDFDQDGQTDGNIDVTIAHNGGSAISGDRLTVTVDGAEVTASGWNSQTSDVSAGQTHEETGLDSDQTIRVIWESADGGNSQILAEYEVN